MFDDDYETTIAYITNLVMENQRLRDIISTYEESTTSANDVVKETIKQLRKTMTPKSESIPIVINGYDGHVEYWFNRELKSK